MKKNNVVVLDGQTYKIMMKDEEVSVGPDDEDIIEYSLNGDEIEARIINPSQHTLYLIEEQRCWIGISVRTYKKCDTHGYVRDHYHPYWACIEQSSEQGAELQRVDDASNYYYFYPITYDGLKGIHGHHRLLSLMQDYERPYRDQFFFDFKLCLLTSVRPRKRDGVRVYSTNSKITRVTFDY